MNRSPKVEAFYVSWAWRKCRTAYAKSKGNLCERCLARGIIEAGSKEQPLETHHKIPLTDENINNPNITLNWSNLELLCKSCHDQEREQQRGRRWSVSQDGSVRL